MTTKIQMIKVFSGSEILALALELELLENEIIPLLKNNIQSGNMAGFGTADSAVDVFIPKTDLVKANPILQKYS